MSESPTAALQFGHKERLLRLQTLHIFDRGEVQTKRRKDKKKKKKEEEEKGKTTNKKETKRPKQDHIIVMSGQFPSLALFFMIDCFTDQLL